ncbi:phage major capsid protein [Streptomyces sp. NPDC005283]|uniref:phage major capsid protein n=1 Tax=Streptomyces sp. NPDC005283 TaxID=3156871 RepID=UPI003454378B
MDIKTAREEMATAIKDARAIMAKADEAGRDMTPGESAEVNRLVALAQERKNRIERATEGAATRDALATLGDDISGTGPRSAKTDVHPRVKASGGTDWADTILKQVGPQGYKGILANGTVAVNVPLDPEPVRSDVPVLTLRQLMPNVQNTSGRFSYLKQTVRTNNAAVVAPGAKKPTSVYTLARVDDRVRTIAHLSEPIAKQDLDDVGLLRQFIDQEMRLGLDLALEGEILNGDGTGEHFDGIGHVSGSQAQAFVTDVLTTTRKAVTKLERFGYMAGAAFVMTPDDWESIELLADNENRFYYGGPQTSVDRSARRLWGAPVVVTEAATTGTAYLADWRQMKLQVRQDGVLDWSENVYDPDALGSGVGASDFERNMLRFRFEGRFGLEIMRPSSIVEIDLTT